MSEYTAFSDLNADHRGTHYANPITGNCFRLTTVSVIMLQKSNDIAGGAE
jgi:hypothetical protein